jgi:hypothetical protein
MFYYAEGKAKFYLTPQDLRLVVARHLLKPP